MKTIFCVMGLDYGPAGEDFLGAYSTLENALDALDIYRNDPRKYCQYHEYDIIEKSLDIPL